MEKSTFKIGDYVRKISNRTKGGRSVTNGFIYWIHPTGHWIKLEDDYGNQSERRYDVKGFKKIKRGIPKRKNESVEQLRSYIQNQINEFKDRAGAWETGYGMFEVDMEVDSSRNGYLDIKFKGRRVAQIVAKRDGKVKVFEGKQMPNVIEVVSECDCIGECDCVNESAETPFTEEQLEKLRKGYSSINGIDPAKPTYKKLTKFLDGLSKTRLQQLADAKIKFVSGLARNRVNKKK